MNRKIATLGTFVLLICCGAVGVQALPTCQKIVKSYKVIRTRNKVSPLTAARWALWNKDHPNFVPHARPKYKQSRKEVIEKVAFACAQPIPISNTQITLLDAPPLTELFDDIPADIAPPISSAVPTLAEVASNGAPILPFVPPYSAIGPGPLPSPVPEPTPLILLLTGLIGVVALRFRKTSLQA